MAIRSKSAPFRVPASRLLTFTTPLCAARRVLDGWWQPLLLLLLPILLFLPGLRNGTPPFGGDVLVLNYPLLTLLKHQLEQGSLPLWNAYAAGGYPLAPFSALIFYPPLWGLRFLSVNSSIALLDTLHFMLAGLGVYVLAGVLGASRTSRLIGALGFLLSGFLISHLFAGHLFETGVIAWMPWVFFAAHQLLERRTYARHCSWGWLEGCRCSPTG